MEYIGTRPGVILNSSASHGLFGVVDGRKAEDATNMHELSRYVEAKTQAGAIAYRAVISLAEEDAMRLGYDDPEKWRELVQTQIPAICGKIGIPIQNLEYTAAVHRDKGHPHVHILFWDKAQDVKKKAYVHYKVSDSIRIGLIKRVFEEELAALQLMKDEARSAAYDSLGGFFDGFTDAFADITAAEYKEAVNRIKREGDLADSRLIYNKFKSADMKELAADLLRLAGHAPQRGRLQFKLMPPEVKDEIIAFIEKVLDKNADCSREFKKYVYAATELAAYYSDNPEAHVKAGKAAYDDMMKRLGNVVLRTVKKLNQLEGAAGQSQKHKTTYRREMIESLISMMFNLLARSADAENRKTACFQRTGELSKQAKKELALRMENSSGYEWE